MAAAQKLEHFLGGTTPATRAEARGYNFLGIAENIFREKGEEGISAQRALTAFINSPEHEENQLGDFERFGVANCVGPDGFTYWAQTFGTGDDRVAPLSCNTRAAARTAPPPAQLRATSSQQLTQAKPPVKPPVKPPATQSPPPAAALNKEAEDRAKEQEKPTTTSAIAYSSPTPSPYSGDSSNSSNSDNSTSRSTLGTAAQQNSGVIYYAISFMIAALFTI